MNISNTSFRTMPHYSRSLRLEYLPIIYTAEEYGLLDYYDVSDERIASIFRVEE
jgi:hypothetical protein